MKARICSCGGLTKVLYVRDLGSGNGEHTKRRRVCVKCGRKFSTREIAVGPRYTNRRYVN